MLEKKRINRALVLFVFGLSSCLSEDTSTGLGNGTLGDESQWNIPAGEIISGGVPKDGIPSLFNPKMISASEANYLRGKDLVVGIVVNGQARAYPHTILDWHEVANEDLPGARLSITLCPLTGTGIVFDGNIAERELSFGVSGLLYNNNLIMFDRQTDSHWPQMRLQSDQGTLRNTKQQLYPSIETSWGTWKKLHPNTLIMSTDTGFGRPYSQPGSAYPGYTILESQPLFRNAVSFRDDRLPPKQRVHGVIVDQAGGDPGDYSTKVYTIKPASDAQIVNDTVAGIAIVVVNDGSHNFAVSYSREVGDQTLTFRRTDQAEEFPYTLTDNETGSNWNVLGEAISGPLSGAKLHKAKSYNAYWFAWATFFIGAAIFE